MKHSPELLVYKASAGSEKTFTLAVEYIKLLIQNPRAYRNILAVTFTNKATTEMKERILSQLYGIWIKDKDSDPYLQKITEELEIPPEDIRTAAGTALHYTKNVLDRSPRHCRPPRSNHAADYRCVCVVDDNGKLPESNGIFVSGSHCSHPTFYRGTFWLCCTGILPGWKENLEM